MQSLTLIDSPLFGASFVNARMRAVFDFNAYIQRCVDCEVALAKVRPD